MKVFIFGSSRKFVHFNPFSKWILITKKIKLKKVKIKIAILNAKYQPKN